MARVEGLVTEELPDEMLVYDLGCHKVHCLGPVLATLWRRCDGRRSLSELTTLVQEDFSASIDEAGVWAALEQLAEARLLVGVMPPSLAQDPSRRRWMRSASAAGFSLLTIAAPTISEAATAISDADCTRRSPSNCGGAPCLQNPGNTCRRVIIGGGPQCSCSQN